MSTNYDVSLLYTFEKNGVLRSVDDNNSVIKHINSEIYKQLKNEGVIAEGMLPKMHNCFNALQRGVSKVIIGNPTVLRNQNQVFTTLEL